MPTLGPHDQLGPYQIAALIGSGGMGEVYRAVDTRLGRAVAVKVLPGGVVSDAGRLRRFEQEARAAAALNHPAILAVHDIGAHEGMPFIVTELLEGQTLRDRLRGGGMGVRKAIELVSQVSDGLAAAHEKGIVHRDLKPENLFITRQDRVKILDFGLAKLLRSDMPAGSSGEGADLATATGLIIGTAGYMAPEQVRGEKADHRADIFAFGTILYEVLSGQRAFRGATAVETLTAILNQEPTPLPELVPDVPPAVDLVVRRCLEKDPDSRFQSARDLTFALASLATASMAAPPVRLAKGRSVSRARGIALMAGVVLAGLGVAAGVLVARRAEPVSFQRLTFRRGTIRTARVASDGYTVVYGAAWDGNPFALYSARVENPESAATLHSGADLLAISDQGELAVSLDPSYLLGYMAAGTLARLPLAGGSARELLAQVQDADWRPGSDDLAVVRQVGNMSRLEFPLGTVLRETSGWLSQPRFSPDGKVIAVVEHPLVGDDRGQVLVVEPNGEGTSLTPVCAGVQGLAWHPQTGEVWYSASLSGEPRAIYAATLSKHTRTVARLPGVVTLHDVTRSGDVLLSMDSARRGILGVFPGDDRERDLSWLDWSMPMALSDDGGTLLFVEQQRGGDRNLNQVYVRPTDGSAATRLAEGMVPHSFTPDGRFVLASDLDSSNLVWLPVGVGEERRVRLGGLETIAFATLTDGGRRVLLVGRRPQAGFQVFTVDADGRNLGAVTPEGIGLPIGIAPDRSRVLVENADGSSCVYSLSGKLLERLPEIPSGLRGVAWSLDGRSVVLQRMGSVPAELYRCDLRTRKLEPWKRLMPADPAGVSAILGVRVTPDLAYYAYSYRRLFSELFLARGLR